MIYFILFTITSIIFFFAEKFFAKSCILFYLLSYFAIFLISFMAGVRENTIGTDILIYGIDTFKVSYYFDNFLTGFQFIAHKSDFLFYTINYFISKITNNYAFLLFIIMFIQTCLVFHAFKKFVPVAPLWLTMLAYECFFYNLTLNLMRQGIAMAFTLWSMKFFDKEQLWKLILCVIIAFLLHKSSIVAYIVIFAIYLVRNRPEKEQYKILLIEIISAFLCVLIFGIILNYISSHIPILQKFSAYGYNSRFGKGVSTMDVGLRLFMIIILLVIKKYNLLQNKKLYITLMFLIADLAGQYLGIYAYFTTRIAYYFFLIEIPYFIDILFSAKITKKTSLIVAFTFISFLTFYSFRFNILEGNNQTYPYKSEILGI